MWAAVFQLPDLFEQFVLLWTISETDNLCFQSRLARATRDKAHQPDPDRRNPAR